VAIRHGLHPNMVHRWWREHRQKPERAREAKFVQLSLPAQVDVGRSTESVAAAPDGGDECIRVEIQRVGANITVHWPLKAAAHCAELLGALLR
jgi:transposase